MEIKERPLSETTSKVLAFAYINFERYNSYEKFVLKDHEVVAIDSTNILKLQKGLKLAEKTVRNCITELVASKYLQRISNGLYMMDITKVGSSIKTITVHTQYKFHL